MVAKRIIQRPQLREMLRKRDISPVYLLFGVETNLRNIAAATIAEFALGQKDLREFNQNEVSIFDTNLSDALSMAEQLPFGGDKRIVLIRDFFVSTNPQTSSLKGTGEERLMDYLENPSDSSVVIFVADEFDKRLKVSKAFVQKSVVVEFAALKENEAIAFAKDSFRKAGAGADHGVITRLVELTGVDSGKLSAEAEKLATAALPDEIVSFELVEKLVKRSRVLSNFDLTDHLVAGKKKEALATMAKIFDDGAEPLMILGLLSYNFRLLCITKDFMAQGLDKREILSRVSLGRDSDRVFSAARRTAVGKFERFIKRIAETDLAIKTSVGSPRTRVEMLVCELALDG